MTYKQEEEEENASPVLLYKVSTIPQTVQIYELRACVQHIRLISD